MFPFRLLLMVMLAGIVIYTGIVGLNHGWNLVPIFFGDMAAYELARSIQLRLYVLPDLVRHLGRLAKSV